MDFFMLHAYDSSTTFFLDLGCICPRSYLQCQILSLGLSLSPPLSPSLSTMISTTIIKKANKGNSTSFYPVVVVDFLKRNKRLNDPSKGPTTRSAKKGVSATDAAIRKGIMA